MVRDSAYLRLSVTDRCNLHCTYCRPGCGVAGEGRDGILPFEDLVSLATRIHGVVPLRKVRITGGEPLVRKGIDDLVRMLRTVLPDVELCLTTNGTLLTRAAIGLKRSGLDRINVSLDAPDPAGFASVTGRDRFDAVVDGIIAAKKAGFEGIRVNAVLLKGVNGARVTDMVRLASDLGVEIRFIELMPFGEAARFHGEEFVSADEALDALRAAYGPVIPLGSSGTSERYGLRLNGKDVVLGFITPVSHPFCDACDRLRLDCRGTLFTCLRHDRGVDISGAWSARRSDELRAMLRSCGPGRTERSWPADRMAAIGG